MVGNFTAIALTVVIGAIVAAIAVCIFAFEIFTLLRERVIRAAAIQRGGIRLSNTVNMRTDNVAYATRDDANRPSAGY
jgi:hypothetical protein